MARYSAERKSVILSKLLPPHNLSVAEVARQEGICEATLYNWRHKAKEQGVPVPAIKDQATIGLQKPNLPLWLKRRD